MRATTQTSTRAAPACLSTPRDLGGGAAGRHHVVDQRDVPAAQLAAPARLDGEGAAHVAGALGRRQRDLVRRVAQAQQQRRLGATAEPRREPPRELPGLVVAALAQARRRRAAPARSASASASAARAGAGLDHRLGEHRREVERGMELERRNQPVPRIGVVDARRRRRRTAAASAGSRRRSRPPRAPARRSAGSAARPARSARGSRRRRGRGPSLRRRRTGSASAAPAAAMRRPRRAPRGRVAGIGSIYCPPWCRTIARAGAASMRSRSSAALRRLAARPEPPWLHVEVGASPGRAPGADAGRARARASTGGAGPGGGHDALRAALSEGRARRRRAGCRRGWHAPRGRPSGAVVVARPRPRGAGPCRRRAGCRARPRPARLGQHGAARRRRSAGAVRALARAARGRWLRRCSRASAPARSRELRELYATLGWPAPTPGFIDMHDLGDMLVAAGFADPVLDQETLTLQLGERRGAARGAAPARRQRRARSLRRPAHAGVARAAWSRRSRRAPTPTAASRSASRSPTATDSRPRRACSGGDVAVSLDDMRAMVRRPRPTALMRTLKSLALSRLLDRPHPGDPAQDVSSQCSRFARPRVARSGAALRLRRRRGRRLGALALKRNCSIDAARSCSAST